MKFSSFRRYVVLLCLQSTLTSTGVFAHESCCKHKVSKQFHAEPQYIDDPTDSIPPPMWKGEFQWIDDPTDTKPDGWDDEDDGEWVPIRILNPKYTWKPRTIPNPRYVQPPTFWERLRTEVYAALPWVNLGVFITSFLSLIHLPVGWLKLWLGKFQNESSPSFSNVFTLLKAALLGLSVPLCSCGSLPLCAGLLHQGVPLAPAMTFLIASQAAGLDSAAITFGLLGAHAVLGRLVGAIVLAVAAGMACPTRSLTKPMNDGNAPSCHTSAVTSTSAIGTLLGTSTEIFPAVLLGLTLSTAALHFLPIFDRFGTSDATSSLWTKLGLLASAVPLQLCEHTAVTLAAAIQKAGGSPGLAFGFLLSAPAINMPSLLFLWSHGGTAVVVRVATSLVTTALVLAYVVDVNKMDFLAGQAAGEMPSLPKWFQGCSVYLTGGLVLAGLYRKYSTSSSQSTITPCC